MLEKRLIAMAGACLLAFAVVVCALAAVSTNPAYAAAAVQQSSTSVVLSEGRGNIYDCGFLPLTGTVSERYALIEPGRTSYHTLFEAIPAELRTQFYASIQRGSPFLMPVTGAAAARAQYTFEKPVRYQPMPIAQHLIGYLGASGHGVSGVEYAFDDLLTGGSTLTEVRCAMNARGGFIESDAPYLVESPGTGAGVMLTLDSSIQRACEAVGIEMVDKGCIVVLDAPTGRVRASVSLPLYDPENVAASIARQDTSLVNRALSAYNVGSVFKPLLAAAALEQGISAQETYECTGSIEVGGHVYRCAYGRGHGTVDMKTALEQSCNCYFVQLAQKLGAGRLYQMGLDFGFGTPIALYKDFQSAAGRLPSLSVLASPGQLALLGFGQGKLTDTPLHFARCVAAIAGGGVYCSPDLTGKATAKPRRVMQAGHAKTLLAYMRTVVAAGTGSGADYRGRSAGKTATAQSGRYVQGREVLNTYFAGVYPFDHPRYAIVVMRENGTSGAADCCPVFRRIVSKLP